MICVPLLGRDPARRDRPIRTGRRDKPIIQLPSIALRVAVILGIAAVMFGIVFFRLWFLQVLSGQEFIAEANDNRLKPVKVVAARGNIVDRNGETIVDNRAGRAVGIRLMDVPEGQLDPLVLRLSRVLKMRPIKMREEIMDDLEPGWPTGDGAPPFTWENVVAGKGVSLDLTVVKQDVDMKVVSYILEHIQAFPGVETPSEYLRSYPQGDMAAQLLGHLGEVSAEELENQHFKGYKGGDVVGKDGLEWTYDKWLRGRDGVARIEVDAFGRPKQTDPVGGRMPDPGDTLVTTLDVKVQAAAEEALRHRHLAGARRRQGRGQRRRRGRARRRERRRAGDGELPHLRPGAVGRRHQHQGLQEARRQVRELPDAQPLHPGDQGGRVDLQGRDRGRRSGGGCDRVGDHRSGARVPTARRTTSPTRRRSSTAGRTTATATST